LGKAVLLNDWTAIALYLGFILVVGLPLVLLKAFANLPFEVARKLYHLLITLSIFPLVRLFDAWYMALLAVLVFALIAYPALVLLERAPFYRRIAVERESGEFKRSLIIVQASIALLLLVFWGILGEAGKYIVVAAVMAWGLGDAAAALVGKSMGGRRITHPYIDGKKTYAGTFAMAVTAGLAVFFTLLAETGQPWQVSLAVALLVAPLSAVVELFSRRGMDTLTVPISTGLAVLLLMALYSFLGS
jgi:phytol kinase